MKITKVRFVAIAATVGAVAVLSAPVAQASPAVCSDVASATSTATCPTSVPEPATLGLLALGLVSAAIARRRK